MIFKDYLADIAADFNINVLAFATTPWHAHGVVASLMRLQDMNVEPNGFIFISPHPLTGYALDESFFNGFPSLKVVKIEKEILSFFENLNKMAISIRYVFRRDVPPKRVIWYIEPWTVNAYHCGLLTKNIPMLGIRHVVYDEGVSTYFPIKLESKGLGSWLQNFYTSNITFGFGFEHIQKTKWFLSAKLFDKPESGQLEKNIVIIPYYVKAISHFSKNTDEDYAITPNTILICTTAWERKEIVTDEDVRVIRSIANELQKRGYSVLFKRHPRDSHFSGFYGCYPVMMQGKQSLESILLSVKTLPAAVVSISSTILVTCKLFLDIRTIDASRLLDASKIGRYVNEVTAFQSTFGHYVESPSSLEEMMNSFDINE